MARSRLIKPGFFKNEDLASLPFEARLLYAGLWTLADRAGRLEDRPARIRAELFPYEQVNIDELLEGLQAGGFILRYAAGAAHYIAIPTFLDHQTPHHKEADSKIPAPVQVEPKSSPGPAQVEPKSSPSVSVSDPVSVSVKDQRAPRAMHSLDDVRPQLLAAQHRYLDAHPGAGYADLKPVLIDAAKSCEADYDVHPQKLTALMTQALETHRPRRKAAI